MCHWFRSWLWHELANTDGNDHDDEDGGGDSYILAKQFGKHDDEEFDAVSFLEGLNVVARCCC